MIGGTLLQDLRFAWRSLGRTPLVSGLAIACIGIAIGAVTTVISTANAFTFRPLPQLTRPSRLLLIAESPADAPTRGEEMSPGAFGDLASGTSAFASVAALQWWDANITGIETPERVPAARVSAQFFRMAGREPFAGRSFTEDEVTAGAKAVVLSHGLWQRRFGADPVLVGRTVRINGEGYLVAGIAPEGFIFPNGVQLWVPLTLTGDQGQERRNRSLTVMARLRDDATPGRAAAEVSAFGARLAAEHAETSAGWIVRAAPAEQIFGQGPRPFMLAMLGAVAGLLLIACANVANLLLARATARRREIAVRTALGASRARIVRQLLTESLMLAAIGGVVGVLLAYWGVGLQAAAVPAELRTVISGFDSLRMDGRALAAAAVVTLTAGVLFGLAPAVAASRTDVQGALKDGGSRTRGHGLFPRLRDLLVVAEVALALALLSGSLLMVASAQRLLRSDPGFRTDAVLTLRLTLPEADYPAADAVTRFWDALIDRVREVPGVRRAAVTTQLPMAWGESRAGVEVEGRPLRRPEDAQRVGLRVVSEGFLPALNVPLVAGRGLERTDGAGAPDVALISATMAARLWPDGNAVGRRLKTRAGRWITVVGVVGDVRANILTSNDPKPVLYLPERQWPARGMTLAVVTAGDPAQLAAPLQRVIASLDARLAAGDVAPMTQVVASVVSPQSATAQSMTVSAVIALLLAVAGTYGVLAYAVALRTHEIGVRVALGAGRRDIVRLVLRQASVVVGAGLLLGLVAALAMGRGLRVMLYETSASDPVSLASAVAVLAGAAAFAAWLPARRAARVDPMVALRAD